MNTLIVLCDFYCLSQIIPLVTTHLHIWEKTTFMKYFPKYFRFGTLVVTQISPWITRTLPTLLLRVKSHGSLSTSGSIFPLRFRSPNSAIAPPNINTGLQRQSYLNLLVKPLPTPQCIPYYFNKRGVLLTHQWKAVGYWGSLMFGRIVWTSMPIELIN